MEEFILITVAFVGICLYLYILYIFYGKKEQNDDVLYNIKSSEDSIDTKEVEEEKIIETKTIHYIENNVETEEKINIVEDNGGILKIAKSLYF